MELVKDTPLVPHTPSSGERVYRSINRLTLLSSLLFTSSSDGTNTLDADHMRALSEYLEEIRDDLQEVHCVDDGGVR